ncbi:MAG: hypothetical protein EOO68_37485 [Moraxellaceae bacterium]|nr:MAG: hypothetical protein EOO68_37485 [Moraxellaceae bacterium]
MKRLVQLKDSIKKPLVLMMLLFANVVMAQMSISNVNPTTATKNTRVIVTGANFGSSTVTIGGVGPGTNTFSVVRTSSQITITFSSQDAAIPVSGPIVVTQASPFATVTAAQTITYIAPVVKNTASGVRAEQIYTDYNNYWTSTTGGSHPTANQPNTRHNLLGFKYGGVVFSTGVNDQRLTDNGVSFIPQSFRAYSTRGVQGSTNGNLFLAMADLIDGTAHNALGNPSSVRAGISAHARSSAQAPASASGAHSSPGSSE